MKTRALLLSMWLMCLAVLVQAQVTTVPYFITTDYEGEVTIIFNPNEGNAGMVGATKCYAHTGVTVNGKQWQHSPTWRDNSHQMTQNADGNWELLISPSIREYYGCAETDKITAMSFVFNDGKGGSKEGKDASGGDIFVNLIDPSSGLQAKIISPADNQMIVGAQELTIVAVASEEAELALSVNGKLVQSVVGTEISYTQMFSESSNEILFSANKDGKFKTDKRTITLIKKSVEQERPTGIDMGIYYDEFDDTKVTLCTYAASKTEPAQAVYVLGDFNNWTVSDEYSMKRDGNYFWLELSDLEPEKEYAFQYMVVRSDGIIKRISDLYSTKLLHPDDKYEPRKLHPELKSYPSQGDGYVTVIQTAKPKYKWSDATINFQRPNKDNLIIYELWVYDYTQERSFAGLMKRLDYLQNLGVNAIELMPVCEFDGNENWGYSPNHYFAVDKAYGSEEEFCQLIDECHKRGMAVIMDMVFNHATGLNPMNKLYPYGADLSKNPWFNVTAPHPDNVYEDWNHDFEPARTMFTRALQYWISEFHIDGYRMDLSHGFCGSNCNNLMTNLAHYYTQGVKAAAEDAYFILEHWGENMDSQRPKLVRQGMMCWNNTNNAYSQLAMGYNSESDLSAASNDGYVSYCESHDEERNYYKAKEYGDGIIKTDEEARLSRIPLTMAFNLLLDGPHMIWQYNEIGYDYSINSTQGSKTISEENRTSKKQRPEPLGWFEEGTRMNQYQKVAQIAQLRTKLLPELFEGDPQTTNKKLTNKDLVRTLYWKNDDVEVFIMGNFAASTNNVATLPNGTWYDYLENDGVKKSGGTIPLKGGELRIFVSKQLDLPQVPYAYDSKWKGLYTDIADIVSDIQANSTKAVKVLHEGRMYIIMPDGSTYSLLGERVK